MTVSPLTYPLDHRLLFLRLACSILAVADLGLHLGCRSITTSFLRSHPSGIYLPVPRLSTLLQSQVHFAFIGTVEAFLSGMLALLLYVRTGLVFERRLARIAMVTMPVLVAASWLTSMWVDAWRVTCIGCVSGIDGEQMWEVPIPDCEFKPMIWRIKTVLIAAALLDLGVSVWWARVEARLDTVGVRMTMDQKV